jgi:hypothetical protein
MCAGEGEVPVWRLDLIKTWHYQIKDISCYSMKVMSEDEFILICNLIGKNKLTPASAFRPYSGRIIPECQPFLDRKKELFEGIARAKGIDPENPSGSYHRREDIAMRIGTRYPGTVYFFDSINRSDDKPEPISSVGNYDDAW